MAEVINMPRLSDTMEEGTVAKWHKKIGDKVEEGDLLAEIETDKATMDFEAFQEGVLLHIGVQEGETVAVDSLLAILGEKGEDVAALVSGNSAPSTKEDETDEKPEVIAEEPKTADIIAPVSNTDRIKASPLAKKLAEEKGVGLSQLKGSGEGGRIVKRDVLNFTPHALTTTEVGSSASLEMKYEELNVSQMRKTIARRLSDSKFNAPHFYLTMEIDMANAIAARKSINATPDTKISFNDLVVKAAAVSLKSHPYINASWLGDKIRLNKNVNIGVAVAVDEGLLVPVIHNTDQKGLQAINTEVKEKALLARDKKLKPDDMQGNTFTISNLGMFGIEEFTAIINAPDSCILAVGGIKETPVVRNGEIVPGNIMKVTLSCDHRVVDGATGAAFLQTFKGIMENPLAMLL